MQELQPEHEPIIMHDNGRLEKVLEEQYASYIFKQSFRMWDLEKRQARWLCFSRVLN